MSEQKATPPHFLNADILRISAMLCVAFHHALTISQQSFPNLSLFSLGIGHIGVAVFFSMSGFFAAKKREAESSWCWLRRRLVRILVPYWVVLTVIFFINYHVEYKSVSAGLIFSQYFGLMVWTHPGGFVGVHLWFVSVLLLCYLLASVLKSFPRFLPLFIVVAAIWMISRPFIAQFVLCFLTGFLCGAVHGKLSLKLLLSLGVFFAGLLTFVHEGLFCVLISVLVVSFISLDVLIFSEKTTWYVRHFSEVSYFFYLVHGPVFLAVERYLSPELWVILILGVAVSYCAAFMLMATDKFFYAKWFKYLARQSHVVLR